MDHQHFHSNNNPSSTAIIIIHNIIALSEFSSLLCSEATYFPFEASTQAFCHFLYLEETWPLHLPDLRAIPSLKAIDLGAWVALEQTPTDMIKKDIELMNSIPNLNGKAYMDNYKSSNSQFELAKSFSLLVKD